MLLGTREQFIEQRITAVVSLVLYGSLKAKNRTGFNAISAYAVFDIQKQTEVLFLITIPSATVLHIHELVIYHGAPFMLMNICKKRNRNSLGRFLQRIAYLMNVTKLGVKPATRRKCSQLHFFCVVTEYCTCPPGHGCSQELSENRPQQLQRSGLRIGRWERTDAT